MRKAMKVHASARDLRGRAEGEKRLEPRYAIQGTAIVRSLSPGGQARVSAKVLDISKNGMKLYIARVHFHPGTVLHILLKNVFMVGEVRYCKALESGFECGIRIEDTTGSAVQ